MKTIDCGCHIESEHVPSTDTECATVKRTIVYCEMHAAAPGLVKVLQRVLSWSGPLKDDIKATLKKAGFSVAEETPAEGCERIGSGT